MWYICSTCCLRKRRLHPLKRVGNAWNSKLASFWENHRILASEVRREKARQETLSDWTHYSELSSLADTWTWIQQVQSRPGIQVIATWGFHMVGQRILHNPQLHVNQFPSPDSGGMPCNNPTKPPLWLVVKPALARPAVPCHAAGARDRGIICSNAACQGYQTTMNTKYLILPKPGQCRQWENEFLLWLLLSWPVVYRNIGYVALCIGHPDTRDSSR